MARSTKHHRHTNTTTSPAHTPSPDHSASSLASSAQSSAIHASPALASTEHTPLASTSPTRPAAAPAGSTPGTPIEPSAAENAYRLLQARLDTIPRDTVAPINVDIQVAAVFALGVSRLVAAPGVRERFARLAKSGEYDDSCVEQLGTAALGGWYCRHRYLLATATRSEAQLPSALVETALALRGRMLRLLEYWLSDDPEVAAELAAIRLGSGHLDLANDLTAAAALSDRHAAVISQDRKLYQAGDAALARQLSGKILETLGDSATAEQDEWTVAQARAWTHLSQVYEEVARGGRFLFARDGGEARFPQLVTAARAAAVRNAKDEPGTPAVPPPAPGPDNTPVATAKQTAAATGNTATAKEPVPRG
jgi:hypothetical protein